MTITIAVAGTGSIGARHLTVLQGMDCISPIAVPLRKERAQELAKEGFAVATDLADAVRQGATHCVIATDTGRHSADCQAALDAGLETLVEKPAAADAAAAYKLRENFADSGLKIYVGCVMRFSESLNTFKSMLPQIDDVHSVRIECQSYMPDWRPNRSYLESYSAQASEGGVLLDLIHEIDYAGWIFGWPDNVQARVRNNGRLGIDADEATEVSWEDSNSAQVSVYLDYLSKPPRRVMRAYGSQGTLEWDGILGTVTLTGADGIAQVVTSSQLRNDTFEAQAGAFFQACQGSKDNRLATINEGAKALAVCDAARAATAGRQEVQVEYL